MNRRPWAEPGMGSSLVYALLFWVGALFVAFVMLSPNLYNSLDNRQVVYLAGFGVLSLVAALFLTRRVQTLRREAKSEQQEMMN